MCASLSSEPLAIQLLNSEFPVDRLATASAARTWIETQGLRVAEGSLDEAQQVLVEIRAVLHALYQRPDDEGLLSALNRILSQGQSGHRLTPQGLELHVQGPESWQPAWQVAHNYWRLMGAGRGRLKKCGCDRCPYFFFDTSPSVTRRWCDMSTCGNRAKSWRYQARNTRRRSPTSF